MILMQTKAIFIDAYRELNAKKLFWLTMVINLLAVFIFASIGINEKGFSALFWTFDGQFNTSMMSAETFYKLQFLLWGVPYWLSWGTTILALISTAGIIPDLVSGGTIEPMLSKPIGRGRLFLTKYLTGLFFVGAQILVFTIGCFLVLLLRAGTTEFGLFLTIPIVLAFFSFLFSVCVFVGIVTRSTITALLLTIMFWLMLFILNVGDSIMINQRERALMKAESMPAMVEQQERFAQTKIDRWIDEGKPVPGMAGEPLPAGAKDSLEAVSTALMIAREEADDAEKSVKTWTAWAARVYGAKLLLPKTQETIGLLSRHLIEDDELDGLINLMNDNNENSENGPNSELNQRVAAVYEARTMTWILGTSFAFEAFLLGLSTIIFIRRDF